uniref:Uncharacterized protein n=1 Tax=Plectus sambesii TaxID=2011161 RepID=A0A914WKV6_9BILA
MGVEGRLQRKNLLVSKGDCSLGISRRKSLKALTPDLPLLLVASCHMVDLHLPEGAEAENLMGHTVHSSGADANGARLLPEGQMRAGGAWRAMKQTANPADVSSGSSNSRPPRSWATIHHSTIYL